MTRAVIAAAAALAAWAAPPARAAEAPPRKPNVLFVAVDDLNDWVGCLGGHPQAATPNLDALAARGLLFANAHCAYPLCNPSRTAVLTGVAPWKSKVTGNEQDWRTAPTLKGVVTLPQYFRDHGYWTGTCGKVFHANQGPGSPVKGLEGFGHPESWDAGYPSKQQQIPTPEVALPTLKQARRNGVPWADEQGRRVLNFYDWGPIDVPDDRTIDGRSVAWAAEQLRADRGKPFFLAVGLYRPHVPNYAPARYFDMFPLDKVRLPDAPDGDVDDLPPAAPRGLRKITAELDRYKKRAEVVRAYLACVAFMDAQLGKLVRALDESGRAKDTVVVLWSDHGFHNGEKGCWAKGTLWEVCTRVPVVVIAPGLTRPGGRTNSPASLLDLYPTLLDACGLPPNPRLDGRSLVPVLRDPAADRGAPAVTAHAQGSFAVRTARWRYIRYGDGSEELYDHEADPREWKNLAKDPGTAAVRADLTAHLPGTDGPRPGRPPKEPKR